jgi:hypothetical protein
MDIELRKKRGGKMTASVAHILMGDLKNDTLEKLVKHLAFERCFGIDEDEERFESAAMRRGKHLEQLALEEWAFRNDLTPEVQVHIDHPTIPMVAATPDGYVAGVCGVEVKTREVNAWMHPQKTGVIPSASLWQCKWQSWCAETPRTDYVNHHPKAASKTKVIPYYITLADCEEMAARVIIVEGRIRAWMRIIEA